MELGLEDYLVLDFGFLVVICVVRVILGNVIEIM